MPELPDLEVFKVNVFDRLTSKRLKGVEVFNPHKVAVAQATMDYGLRDRELMSIGRVGKELVFDFGQGRIVTAHLMLSGQMSIVDESQVAAIRHKIFAFYFENEALVLSDMGGLCTIRYMPVMGKVPDAFGDAFTADYFLDIARKKRSANIKAFLIDQNVVKGIGNAYADEILWAARVSPHSTVGKIPGDVMVALHGAIGTVLRDAIASIRGIAPGIISGEERSFLQVHNKRRKVTETGYPILVERIASKTTYYTREQVLYM